MRGTARVRKQEREPKEQSESKKGWASKEGGTLGPWRGGTAGTGGAGQHLRGQRPDTGEVL